MYLLSFARFYYLKIAIISILEYDQGSIVNIVKETLFCITFPLNYIFKIAILILYQNI